MPTKNSWQITLIQNIFLVNLNDIMSFMVLFQEIHQNWELLSHDKFLIWVLIFWHGTNSVLNQEWRHSCHRGSLAIISTVPQPVQRCESIGQKINRMGSWETSELILILEGNESHSLHVFFFLWTSSYLFIRQTAIWNLCYAHISVNVWDVQAK